MNFRSCLPLNLEWNGLATRHDKLSTRQRWGQRLAITIRNANRNSLQSATYAPRKIGKTDIWHFECNCTTVSASSDER